MALKARLKAPRGTVTANQTLVTPLTITQMVVQKKVTLSTPLATIILIATVVDPTTPALMERKEDVHSFPIPTATEWAQRSPQRW